MLVLGDGVGGRCLWPLERFASHPRPASKREGAYVWQSQHSWTLVKYEHGHVYVKSFSH